MHQSDALIHWNVPAYEHRPKHVDWYWILGILSVSGAVLAFTFENYLFAVLILLSAFVLALYGSKEPPILSVTIRERGVHINRTLYPFLSLRSFFVIDAPHPKLMLTAQSAIAPYIIVPLGDDVDPVMVREILLTFLDEEEMVEPLPHRIMDRLGF